MNEPTIPIVEAYVSVYEAPDAAGDRIACGAYNRYTQVPAAIPFCNQHETRVGWWLERRSDAFGLRVKGYVDLSKPGAEYVLSQLRARQGGFSVSIRSKRSYANLKVIAQVRELEEASWTPIPAQPMASLISVGYASSIPIAWKAAVRRGESLEWVGAYTEELMHSKFALRRQEALATRRARAALLHAREEDRRRDPLFN
jgi:HK97 family phage prohead protease